MSYVKPHTPFILFHVHNEFRLSINYYLQFFFVCDGNSRSRRVNRLRQRKQHQIESIKIAKKELQVQIDSNTLQCMLSYAMCLKKKNCIYPLGLAHAHRHQPGQLTIICIRVSFFPILFGFHVSPSSAEQFLHHTIFYGWQKSSWNEACSKSLWIVSLFNVVTRDLSNSIWHMLVSVENQWITNERRKKN